MKCCASCKHWAWRDTLDWWGRAECRHPRAPEGGDPVGPTYRAERTSSTESAQIECWEPERAPSHNAD